MSVESISINERELLHEEIAEFQVWEKTKKEKLTGLFLRSAEKLEKSGAFKDTHEIASRLYKIFGKEYERDIRRYLPDKYKKQVSKPIDEGFEDQLDEALAVVEDLLHDMLNAISTLHKKIKTETSPAKKEAMKQFVSELISGNFAGLPEFIKECRDLYVQLMEIKQMQDDRQKIDMSFKVLVKIWTLVISKNDMGKQLKLSSKWIKAINTDPEVAKALESLDKCPWCSKPIAEEIKKLLAKHDAGKTIKNNELPPLMQEQ